MSQLGQATPRLLCSLVHKFGRRDVDDFDAFIKELEAQPSQTVGEVFVFVDECHRTQSGKLHRVMKAMMPNAVFIGFTGTPLLKKDRQTSLEVFGGYIHTYKFSEGVEDEVVLDLVYEARDIDQRLGSEDKIDAWFEAKTKGLNDWQKDELKKQWGTMQNVLSSKSRMDRVVSDIVFDFSVKPRLSSERGNAILVASSIYEACKYFTLFQKTPFKGKCAVVTSYNPLAQDVTLEETGANTETDKQFIYNTYTELLKDVDAKPGMTKTETYEERAKALFIKEPANMKLLVVVDKLLTGFDAPPCTYLYIDKSMQDHGLFQAICRTNRLDGEDKDFGYIVDYKDLFKKVENAIAVYTSELDHSAGGADPEVLLQDRLKKGKERLDNALEALALLCEPVEPPKGELEHIHYFCGNTEIPADLKEREPQRAALYKATVALVRAYANIADELEAAGYSAADIARIKQQLDHYLNVREIIRKASGETPRPQSLRGRHAAPDRHLHRGRRAAEDLALRRHGPAGPDREDRHRRCDRQPARRAEGQQGRRRRDHREQRPQQDHQGAPERPGLLREDVGAAGRDHRRPQGEGHRVRGIPEAHRRTGEAGGGRAGGGHAGAARTRPGKRALYNNLQGGRTTRDAGDRDAQIDETVKTGRGRRLARRPGPRAGRSRRRCMACLQDVAEVERIFLIIKAQSGILMATQLKLGDIAVDVVLKDIKNVHLSVYPPTGRVRISAPSRMSLDTIRVFAISKLGWIKQQQKKLREQERETPREYLDRESHYVWGKRYLLKVVESDEPPSVELKHSRMLLRVRPGTDERQETGHR